MYHRDIKPKNILLKDDLIKLTDFGLVKILKNNVKNSDNFQNSKSIILGTASYMSPELLESFHQQTYKG